MSFPDVFSLPDSAVDDRLDAEIRALLCACFTGEDDRVFAERRWFKEPPRHRWMLRDPQGALAAHIAMHDKRVGTARGERRIAGLSEVAVRPDSRKRGYARLLISQMHGFARGTGTHFAMLFGRTEVYASSGYCTVPNPLRHFDLKAQAWKTHPLEGAMAAKLAAEEWPQGEIDLRGPTF